MAGNPKFVKGMPKPPGSGRKVGSKNKKTLRMRKVMEVLSEMEKDPVTEILHLLSFGDLRDAEKVKAWFDLLSYCQAKPKEVLEGDSQTDDELADEFSDVPSEALHQALKIVKDTDEAL